LRLYVTDRLGKVLYDSTGRAKGEDFSKWRDIALALRGQYGARSTPDIAGHKDSSVMYVTAPVRWPPGGEIVGTVCVGKPVQSFGQFVIQAQQRTLYVGVISAITVAVLALFVSIWLVRPFGLIADYTRFIKNQQGLHPLKLLRHGWALTRAAYDDMRDTLAGRNYVADYVQTLTHEVKSPLSVIRGAAELLQEPMDETQRQRFIGNIAHEALRIQDMINRMMELTALQTRRVLDCTQTVALQALLHDLAHTSQAVATQRDIRLVVQAPLDYEVQADPFLLRQALTNLLDNALQFSPMAGLIELGLSQQNGWVHITVCDQGPGIAAYAQNKVFEKFYSLPRPNSQKKSTGLGLSFVKEIAALHKGGIELANRPIGQGPGALATLTLRQR
jgi:two-component system, OmpR family, sensor histidine kinase CreC